MTRRNVPSELEGKGAAKGKAKNVEKQAYSQSYFAIPLSGNISDGDRERIQDKYLEIDLSDPDEYLVIDLLMAAELRLTRIVRASLYEYKLKDVHSNDLDEVIELLKDVRRLAKDYLWV